MKTRSFLILVVLASLAALGAWLLAFRPTPPQSTDATTSAARTGEPFAPAIRGQAEAIASIEIVRPGDDEPPVRLQRTNDQWLLASMANFPAEPDRVRQLVTSLSELRTDEPKTANTANHARLAVQWPDDEPRDPDDFSARPTLVRLLDADDNPIAEIVLGDTTYIAGEARRYARLLDNEQSWLVAGSVTIPSGPLGFVNTRFVELPRDSVQSVTITHPDGEVLSLTRDDPEGDFVVADIPDGMAMTNKALANNTGNALAFVNFTDVADTNDALDRSRVGDNDTGGPITEDPFGRVTASYETFDGSAVSLRVQTETENDRTVASWVWIGATGENSETITGRYGAHAFKLPASTIESLTRRASDLLQSDLLQENPPETVGPSLPEDAGLPPPTDN